MEVNGRGLQLVSCKAGEGGLSDTKYKVVTPNVDGYNSTHKVN